MADLPLVRIDVRTHTVTIDGQPLELRRLMYRTLVYLAERAGDVVSIDELASDVWFAADPAPVTKTIQQHISDLRGALSAGRPDVRYIATVNRAGYRFEAAGLHPESVLTPRTQVVVQVDGRAFADALNALSDRVRRLERALAEQVWQVSDV